jgi:hypothetical protein
MANSLNKDLNNCLVVLGRAHYPANEPEWENEENRTVLVYGGFGASPEAMGGALFVRDNKGNTWRAEGHMVERLIREVPVNEQAITYIVTVMTPDGVETHEVSAITPTSATREVLELRGWGSLPHRIGDSADDILIEIDGSSYILSPKMKGAS